jgi:hypothetical protein
VQQVADTVLTDDDWTAGLSPGRLPLYVCPECADLYCGALTVHAARAGSGDSETVVWSDFRYEDGLTDPAEMPDVTGLGPYIFKAAEYATAFEPPLVQLQQQADRLAAAEAAWRARRRPGARLRRLLAHNSEG